MGATVGGVSKRNCAGDIRQHQVRRPRKIVHGLFDDVACVRLALQGPHDNISRFAMGELNHARREVGKSRVQTKALQSVQAERGRAWWSCGDVENSGFAMSSTSGACCFVCGPLAE